MPYLSNLLRFGSWQLPRSLLRFAGGATVLIPWGLLVGPAGTEAVVIPIGVAYLIHIATRRDLSSLRHRWVQAILALWLLLILRTTVSQGSWLNVGEAAATARYGLFAIALATWILPDPIWRRRLGLSIAFASTFLALDALFQFVTGADFFGRPMIVGRLTGPYSFPRVGIMLAWLAPLGALTVYELGWRKASLGIFCIAIMAIALSGERAAFLTITLVTVALSAIVLRSPMLALRAVLGAGVIIAALMLAFPHVFQRQIASTADGIVNLHRTHYGIIWDRALKMAVERPWIGYGYSVYEQVCPRPEFGPQAVVREKLKACANHPHNIFVEFLVAVGAIGVSIFVAFILAMTRVLWRARQLFAANPVFTGLVLLLAIRLFPLNTSTEFFRTWSAVPFWLHVGWALALAYSVRTASHAGYASNSEQR